MIDDFSYANMILEHGFWKAQKVWYDKWTGRLLGTLFVSLPATNLEESYKWMGFIHLLFFGGSFCYLIYSAIAKDKRNSVLWYSSALLLLLLVALPSLEEGFLFLSSYGNYTFPIALFFIFLALQVGSSRTYLFSVIILLSVSLFNEFTTLIVGLLFALLLFHDYIYYKQVSKKWLLCGAIVAVGFLIMYSSPGVESRVENPYNELLYQNIYKSIVYGIYSSILFISDHILTFSFIAFLPFLFTFPVKKKVKLFCESVHGWVWIIFYFLGLLLCCIAHFYLLGVVIPERIKNLFFILALFIVFIHSVKYRSVVQTYLSPSIWKILTTFFISFALISPTYLRLVSSIAFTNNDVISFSHRIQKRRAIIQESVVLDKTMPSLTPIPSDETPNFFFYEEGAPDYWQPVLMKYYELQHKKAPTTSKPH